MSETRLAAMNPEDEWVDKFYAALAELWTAVKGTEIPAMGAPPHIVMARLIEDVAWAGQAVRRAQQCSACHHVTCSDCGYVVPPHDEEQFRSHVCAGVAGSRREAWIAGYYVGRQDWEARRGVVDVGKLADEYVWVAGLNASESPLMYSDPRYNEAVRFNNAHRKDASESPPTHGITDPNAPPGWKCGDPLCRWHGTQSAFTRGDASESPPTGPPDPLCPTCDAKGAVSEPGPAYRLGDASESGQLPEASDE